MSNFFLFFLLMPFALFSLSLKEQFKDAKPGDYVVIEQDRQMTMMLIHDKNNEKLYLEEISIPESFVKEPFPWKSWLKKKAPKNTSWIMYEIDLHSGKIKREFSFTHNSWIDPNLKENFLPTLLNLNFIAIPEEERRRSGHAPEKGEKDKRPLWQPYLIVEGQALKGAKFNGWKAHWPKDGSFLSEKNIEIYLPQDPSLAPNYFPYWLQISDHLAKANIRIIDSGRGALSTKEMPN